MKQHRRKMEIFFGVAGRIRVMMMSLPKSYKGAGWFILYRVMN